MFQDQGSLRLGSAFLALGLAAIAMAFTGQGWELNATMTWFGVAFFWVGLAYLFARPGFFLKRATGVLPPASYLAYGPLLLFNLSGHYLFRRLSREKLCDPICENLYLGGRLYASDRDLIETLHLCAVLDLRAEFAESAPFRDLNYLSLPVLDACAPGLEQLEQGVAWITQQTAAGPVYVHCALGRGRSATFVAAYLLASGRVASVTEAVDFVAQRRPQIGLTRSQRRSLEEFVARGSLH